MRFSPRYRERSLAVEETLRQVFAFENEQAPYIVFDANYWLFGELPEDVPPDYCGPDPGRMIEFQVEKIEWHHGLRRRRDPLLRQVEPAHPRLLGDRRAAGDSQRDPRGSGDGRPASPCRGREEDRLPRLRLRGGRRRDRAVLPGVVRETRASRSGRDLLRRPRGRAPPRQVRRGPAGSARSRPGRPAGDTQKQRAVGSRQWADRLAAALVPRCAACPPCAQLQTRYTTSGGSPLD